MQNVWDQLDEFNANVMGYSDMIPMGPSAPWRQSFADTVEPPADSGFPVWLVLVAIGVGVLVFAVKS